MCHHGWQGWPVPSELAKKPCQYYAAPKRACDGDYSAPMLLIAIIHFIVGYRITWSPQTGAATGPSTVRELGEGKHTVSPAPRPAGQCLDISSI